MESTKIPNNTKIVLEMTAFDAQLILPALKEQYYKEATWGLINPNEYLPRYGYLTVSKKAKQLSSIIKHIEKQLKEQGL